MTDQKNTKELLIELKDCPFCGASNDDCEDTIDPHGVLFSDGVTSPQCMECGATAESVDKWNKRYKSPVELDLRRQRDELREVLESLVNKVDCFDGCYYAGKESFEALRRAEDILTKTKGAV